jgi:phage terminase large subunit-like protein
VVSVDASFKGNENSDDVAVQAWGMAGVNSYLIKRDTRKMGFAATKAAIRAMVRETGATIVLIEDKANGSAIRIDRGRTDISTFPRCPDCGNRGASANPLRWPYPRVGRPLN